MKGKSVCGALVLMLGCLKSPVVNDHDHERKVLDLANGYAEQKSLQSRQMGELQKQWQTERTHLNEQRDRLEAERQELAIRRQRERLLFGHSPLMTHAM